MEIGVVLSFLGASILLTLMPGPDNIFVITESLTKGKRNGIAISIGLSTGILVHTIAAVSGLSLLIQSSALVFTMIKYMGAGYLFYLAIIALKDRRIDVSVGHCESNCLESKFYLVRKGFLMNVLNPKVSLFFIAFLPQFISHSEMSISLQMLVLGVIFMIQSVLLFSCFSILSGSLTSYLNSQRFWKITKWSKVSVLFLLGLSLALVGR